MEEYILINDAILCVPGWLAALGAFLKNNWQAVLSTGAQVVGAVGNLFSQKKANEANAAEAEKARNWQERMYNLHESPAAQFVERKSAGLNVLDGIQSQSVGSASTAAPQQPLDFTSVMQLPLLFQQLKRSKLDNQYQSGLNDQQALDYQIKEEQLISQRLQNFEQAFRNGKLDEVYEQQKLLLKAQSEREHWSSKYTQTQFELLDLQYEQAKEADDNGYNPYMVAFEKSLAEIDYIKSQRSYTDALRKTEDSLRDGKITAQDLANNIAAFEYKLKQDYGEELAQLELKDLRMTVNRHEELKVFYDALVKDAQKRAAYEAGISEINFKDLQTLKPWQRMILQFGKEVVEKGAELVL